MSRPIAITLEYADGWTERHEYDPDRKDWGWIATDPDGKAVDMRGHERTRSGDEWILFYASRFVLDHGHRKDGDE